MAVADLDLDPAVQAAEDARRLLPLGGPVLLHREGHGHGPYTMMIVIARAKRDQLPDTNPADSKRRMVESAALLFREQGYSGTGFNALIEHSGAPRGSIYHHFPGGKAQLAAETVRYAGEVVATHLARVVRDGDPVAALRVYLAWWERTLERSDFRAGCPVVAIAVEVHDDRAVVDAAAEAFEQWERMFAAALRDAGVPRARAARVATLTVAAIEGAVVLCRAERSTQPLRDVGRELEAVIAAARDEQP